MQTNFEKYPSPAYGDVQKEETEWLLKEKSLNQEKWKRRFPLGINVFSAFDGISATQVALEREGIPVNNYYSSEIDKPAIAITQKNYPYTIQLGDIRNISGSDLPKIDLFVGGSPCQGFSFAGDQLAFDDPRSALFFEFERLLHEIKPTYFLLENVKMKKRYQDVISSRLNCEPIEINSALLSPQSRRRLYWTNINGIQQPKDLHLYLKHILEPNAGKEYNVSQHLIDGYKGGDQLNPNYKSQGNTIHRQKVATLCAGTHGYAHGYVERPCELRDFNPKSECHHVATASDINGHDYLKRVYADSGKSPTLNAHGGGNTEPKVLCGAWRGRYLKDGSGKTEQKLEVRQDGKTNSLTTVQKDNVVVDNTPSYRKLTPKECERLQTFPDEYTNGISNTQRYKCLGNSFTVDVIAHILSTMDGTFAEHPEQLEINI